MKDLDLHRFSGYSVTGRIKSIKQPYGGYLPIRQADKIHFGGSYIDTAKENISGITVGLCVDYITRVCLEPKNKEAIFTVSLRGARIIGEENKAKQALKRIKGLNTSSIKYACLLSSYDTIIRAGISSYRPLDISQITDEDVKNIKEMVTRTISFLTGEYGKLMYNGFVMYNKKLDLTGYTDIVSTGDGDFITEKGLWDLKVYKNNPTKTHTLQILMYYLMSQKAKLFEVAGLDKLQFIGLYNPRKDILYRYNVDSIPSEVINEVEKDVIGYKD